MTDWKARCATLIDKIDYTWGDIPDDVLALISRTRAELAQPEPERPTDDEIDQLSHEKWKLRKSTHWAISTALTRWGRPAIKPVPVSERLPGPEDCDGCGNCWWFRQATRDDFSFWWLGGGDNTSTHWLPHHALPVPQP